VLSVNTAQENDKIESLIKNIEKNIDLIKTSFELSGKCFEVVESRILFPFLKILLKKYFSSNIIKNLQQIVLNCDLSFISNKLEKALNALKKKPVPKLQISSKGRETTNHLKKISFESKFPIKSKENQTNNKNIFMREKVQIVKKKENETNTPKNRSSRFLQKFILKDKVKAKPTQGNNVSCRMSGSSSKNDASCVPDFFKLNRQLKQDGILEDSLHEIKKNAKMRQQLEELETRKLPDFKKNSKNNKTRRIRTSFNYTRSKTVTQQQPNQIQNDENIVNISNSFEIFKNIEFQINQESISESSDQKLFTTNQNILNNLESEPTQAQTSFKKEFSTPVKARMCYKKTCVENSESEKELEMDEWEEGVFGNFTPSKNFLTK
jgi:hypothetical protein